MAVGEQITILPVLCQRGTKLRQNGIAFCFDRCRVLDPLNKKFVEQWLRLDQIHHIGNFVHAEFLCDHSELCFENFANPMLDGVFEYEIDGSHNMRLPDAVHAPNTLLDPHRVPRHVEVDDDMAELKIEALAASVRRDQDTHILGECPLRAATRLEVHTPIESCNREPPAFEKFREHGLGRNKLSENQNLEFRIVFLLLNLVDLLKECFGFCVCSLRLCLTSEEQECLNVFSLVIQGIEGHGDIDLVITR